MSTTGFKRAGAAAGVVVATGAALLLGSGVASAHVTAQVIGEDAAQDGYAKITFRVPNEDEKAGTVKLEVSFPTDTPLSGARTKPMPGWQSTVTMTKLAKPVEVNNADVTEAVGKITWTADPGTRIAPGQFQEFEVSAGPLPETDQLVMPTTQTYDDKKVVAWDTPTKEGAEEPEHPAPAIALAPAGEGGDHHGGTAAAGHDEAAAESHDVDTAAAESSTSDDTARWLGGAGLVVGALGLGVGVGATMRARRTVRKAGSES
ncbi:MAG TPA: YcnI family protein [Actinophytocola sp.]|jgi:uncharacterized protein YcnI|nr:YcnI family protein [Actinophytocola sp.]